MRKLPFKGFDNRELRFIVGVLLVVGLASIFNFERAYVRSRDVQRKNDLKHIATALASYAYDFGSYPASRDGKILACGIPEQLRPCEWGADGLRDISDLSYPAYTDPLPNDPQQSEEKARYIYKSNTQNFQLFASLENKMDDEYNRKVADLQLPCMGRICNFMVTSNSAIVGVLDEKSATESVLPNGKK